MFWAWSVRFQRVAKLPFRQQPAVFCLRIAAYSSGAILCPIGFPCIALRAVGLWPFSYLAVFFHMPEDGRGVAQALCAAPRLPRHLNSLFGRARIGGSEEAVSELKRFMSRHEFTYKCLLFVCVRSQYYERHQHFCPLRYTSTDNHAAVGQGSGGGGLSSAAQVIASQDELGAGCSRAQGNHCGGNLLGNEIDVAKCTARRLPNHLWNCSTDREVACCGTT